MQVNQRDLEAGIQTDFSDRLSYGGYLCLDQLLKAQQPLSTPVHHDEMLFIIQHQVSELWIKLLIHELRSAIAHVECNELASSFKILARVKLVQQQLFNMWAVLETMTPSEYAQFRPVLGQASGFQSHQYRTLEFLLGNKHAGHAEVFRYDPVLYAQIQQDLYAPSLWDVFLQHLARRGFPVPEVCLQRDFSQAYVKNPGVVVVLKTIYQQPETHWEAYEMAEKLVDVEEAFQLWRFRHMKTVERIIGFKPGTGGSSGVAFLKRALELTFFPELFQVRSEL
ncbi:tryptophan 2,3-dioxygenase [Chitinimonas sp. PSY-7]|uniref:tryptophan 2,3-dioxygenase family protein n=1 Tax=Chitinimonas sp. PSY-7 TaxID=3459088 RepID=UPI0040402EBF